MAGAFLGALFEQISNEWDTGNHAGNQWPKLEHGQPDTPEYIRRAGFFAMVGQRASQLLKDNTVFRQESKDLWSRRLSTGTTSTYAQESDETPNSSRLQWHDRVFNKFCLESFKRLAELVHNAGHNRVFIALDECRGLGASPPRSEGPSRNMSLIALQRIIKAAETLDGPVRFWFLLLDTNSSIVELHPSGPDAPSWRLAEDHQPLPPFCYFPFNQHSDQMKRDLPSDALNVEYLRCIGRPVSQSELFLHLFP